MRGLTIVKPHHKALNVGQHTVLGLKHLKDLLTRSHRYIGADVHRSTLKTFNRMGGFKATGNVFCTEYLPDDLENICLTCN